MFHLSSASTTSCAPAAVDMTVDPFARPDLVEQLVQAIEETEDDQSRLLFVRKLRNALVGNKQRKQRLGTDILQLQL